MELGDKFKSVSTGEIFTVEAINGKFNQIIVMGEDGKSKAYSATTLKDKRRFIPVNKDDQYVQEVMQQKKDLGIECPEIDSHEVVDEDICADGSTYAEIGKEIAEQAKVKAEQAKSKAPETGIGTDIKDYAVATAKKLGAEVCESNGRFISFKVNNKMFAAIFSYSKKSLTLGVRSKSIEGKINPDSTANHMMDARFKFNELSDHNMNLITDILTSAFEYQGNNKK